MSSVPAGMGRSESPRTACVSCRQRKLKCDRNLPCANCTARSVDCKQQQVRSASRGIRKLHGTQTALPDILSRLDRLEALLDQTHTEGIEDRLPAPVQRFLHDATHSSTPATGEIDVSPSGGENEAIRTESGQLVLISTNDSILLQALSPDLYLSVDVSSTAPLNCGLESNGQYTGSRKLRLPSKRETLRQFQIYLDHIGQFQQVIFEPHARSLIEDVYYQVSHVSATTAPRGIALIFSILAISVLLAPPSDNLHFNQTMRDRLNTSAVYIRAALDCLEQTRRRMDHALENVQAMVILSFLINHIEAFSPRYRTILGEALTVARILNLHQLDTKIDKRGQSSGEDDPILAEIKRRVWWYLVATDWMSSLVAGPGGSVCTSQTKHITTNTPRHINSDDLAKANTTDQPLSQPTTMSYVLQRLKMAEIARCVADAVADNPNEATYEAILSLDTKIEQFLEQLPHFFKIEKLHSTEVRLIDQKHPYIPVQRLTITMLINLVRCKIHFPYLVGSPNGALHIFSRQICLQAARQVLAAHQEMSTSNVSRTSDFMKVQGTVYHMFMGAVILATDLCCNRPRGAEREQQSSELMRACSVLASIKQHSQIAAKLLESLTELLIKYGVWPPSVTIPPTFEPASTLNTGISEQWQLEDYSVDNSAMEQQDLDMPLVFDDLWETFIEKPSALDFIDIV